MNNRRQIIQANIDNIRKRMAAAAERSGRSVKDILLIAVTKNVPVEDIRIAIEAGLKYFGENKVQEAKQKIFKIGPVVSWHMLGHLQTNKARLAAAIFDYVQSIDSGRIADRLDFEARRLDRQINVLVEVNISAEEQKFGIAVQETQALADYVINKPSLRLQGLMAMAPYVPDAELARPFFRKLHQLFQKCQSEINASYPAWKILSMGMTNDFEVAIEEGSSCVRIGTGIFNTSELRRCV